MMSKNLYIISGCNGAGKTTASYTVLPEILDCREFVNADEIALNSKAKEQYDKIYASYTNLNKHFKKIADEYNLCVTKKSIQGASITKQLKKVATKCEDQGKYCLNRQKDLKNLYKEAQVAKHYQDLEDTVKQQAELINALSSRIDTLEEAMTEFTVENGYMSTAATKYSTCTKE